MTIFRFACVFRLILYITNNCHLWAIFCSVSSSFGLFLISLKIEAIKNLDAMMQTHFNGLAFFPYLHNQKLNRSVRQKEKGLYHFCRDRYRWETASFHSSPPNCELFVIVLFLMIPIRGLQIC